MTRPRIALFLFGLWALLWIASWAVPATMAPTGDSFTRGMNRVLTFFLLQIGAGLVALILLAFQPKTGRLRWMAWGPAALAALLALAVAAVILWARFDKPDHSAVPPKQPTTQAAPAVPTQSDR